MRKELIGGLIAAAFSMTPICATARPSCQQVDFNSDGLVNEIDIEIFKTLIGKSVGETGFLAAADLDGSGSVTAADFRILLSCR